MQARLQNAAAGILLAGVAEMLADLKAEKFEVRSSLFIAGSNTGLRKKMHMCFLTHTYW